MVNVTKENFIEQSNDLIQHLSTAAFVAIDEEMTGIQVPLPNGSRRPMRKDLPPKLTYGHLKQAPERYSIIQLGVSLFHYNGASSSSASHVPAALHKSPDDDAAESSEEEGQDEDDAERQAAAMRAKQRREAAQAAAARNAESTWTVRSYNFYMFPSASARWDDTTVAREIVLNPSSVSFLHEHKMSFDKWTKDGVNYVTRDRAEQIIAEYVTKHQKDDEQAKEGRTPMSVEQTLRRSVDLTRTDDIRFFASAMAGLREWLDNAAHLMPQAYLLPSCNSFLRRALYENIQKEYPDLILENAGGGQIRVLRLSQMEKKEREQQLRRDAWSKMIMNVGMWRVFDALSRACRGDYIHPQSPLFAKSFDDIDITADLESSSLGRRIPLVVHNGFMDILFLMTHFDRPVLPDALSECKELITSYFPVIYDTKVVSTEHTSWSNEQTNLSNLYHSVVRDNDALLSSIEHLDWVEDSQQEHEAAYDAFMTGSIYLGLCKHIHAAKKLHQEKETCPIVGDLWHLHGDSSEILALACDQREYFGRNKIFQMSMYTLDLQNTELDGLKRGMLASSCFHVSDIDPSVSNRDIIRCFSDLTDSAGRMVNFDIIWIDDTSFIVSTTSPRLENMDQESAAEIHQEHCGLMRRALENRFSKQEKVVSLEQHLKAQGAAAFDDQPSWFRRVADKFAAYLGYQPGKRKVETDGLEMAPAAKRRRYN